MALVVRRSGEPGRRFVVSAGCRLDAVGGGVVGLTCAGSRLLGLVVMDQADGSARLFPDPMVAPTLQPNVGTLVQPGSFSYDRVLGIGSEWLLADTSSSPDGVHIGYSRMLLNWRTGRTISLGRGDPFGVRRYPDLDSAGPGRRLCAPVTRAADKGPLGPYSDVRFATVERIGQWVLQSTGSIVALQRCGARTVTRYATGLDPRGRKTQDARATLGRDAVAYLQGRRIVYRDLRSNSSWSVPWPTTERPLLAMFGRQLIVSAPKAAGRYAIYSAAP